MGRVGNLKIRGRKQMTRQEVVTLERRELKERYLADREKASFDYSHNGPWNELKGIMLTPKDRGRLDDMIREAFVAGSDWENRK